MIHGDVLGERARLSPERTALVVAETGERFTYRQLDAWAASLAATFLGPLGLAPGDRVGILSHNRPEFVAAFFAAAKSGCVLVPMGTRLTPRELVPIVEDSGMAVILVDGALAGVADGLRGTGVRAISLDEPLPEGPANLVPGRPEVGPEDLMCLLYTSGTTGRPKGVMVPHRMVGWNAYNTAVAWDLGQDDVSPIFTPLYHAGGLGAFLAPILLAGGTIVLFAKFDADAVWRSIGAEGATVVLGVPTIWKMLLDSPEIDRVDGSRLRWLISGGAPLPRNLLAAYQQRGLVLKQGYGMTEVGVNCFVMSEAESVSKAGSIGRPLPFTEARLTEDGELLLRGPHVCKGYWRNEDATKDAIDAEGFFHTGDLATCDADGFYTIVGRKKDMYISGGVNVYPAELEAVLLEHPSVREAAVTGVPHATWGEMGVAFVVAREGEPVDRSILTAFLEARVARFKVPGDFVLVDALPVTAYGKVVKGELRARYLSTARAS